MSDNHFPFFAHRSLRNLKFFTVIRHHDDGDLQHVHYWCTSIEEAVIDAVDNLSVGGWHIESITMDCDHPQEDEFFEDVMQQNFDNEFHKIIQQFHNDN